MVLYLGENRLLVVPLCPGSARYWCPPDGGLRVRPLSSVWHIKLEGKKMWTIKQHCKRRSTCDKTHLFKVAHSVHRSGQIWSCGSFWRVVFCYLPCSVGWDTQPDYVPWAMDSVMYCLLSPAEPPVSPAQYRADKISKAGTFAKIPTIRLEIFD